MNKTIKYTLAIVSLLAVVVAFIPGRSLAGTSSLYLTPSSLSQSVGSDFTIYVGVNSGGNSINAIEATVTIPGILAITAAGTGGSLCSIWVQQPTISGSTVSFKCGIPGGTTASGNLISISLKAATVGSGNASISAGRVLAGPGVDVTGGSSGGAYTVTAASATSAPAGGGSRPAVATGPSAPRAPAIASASHPDQNHWYTSVNPTFSWPTPSGATGYSYLFDGGSDNLPPAIANLDGATSMSFTDQPDGIWYFHLRAYGAGGWGAGSTYRVQIDKTAPTGLTVITEPKVTADKRPMVSFAAVDATSGIDHYDISLDKAPFKLAISPYTPTTITSGHHIFTVRAYDKAGNMVEAAAGITIKNIPAPKITSPQNHAILKLIQKLQFSGTSQSATTVDLYVDGKNVARGIKVSSSGQWSYTRSAILLPGAHTLTAKAVKDGIESQPSAKTTIRIDPSAISLFGITFPIYFVIVALLAVIAALALLAVWLFFATRRNYRQMKDRQVKKNQQTEKVVTGKITSLQNDIHEDMQAIYGTKLKTPKDKHRLQDQIENKISTTREVVKKEIEKEIGDDTKNLR